VLELLRRSGRGGSEDQDSQGVSHQSLMV